MLWKICSVYLFACLLGNVGISAASPCQHNLISYPREYSADKMLEGKDFFFIIIYRHVGIYVIHWLFYFHLFASLPCSHTSNMSERIFFFYDIFIFRVEASVIKSTHPPRKQTTLRINIFQLILNCHCQSSLSEPI